MVLRLIDRAIEAIAVLCLVLSTGMICANVFYRYVVLDWLRVWAKSADWLTPSYVLLNDLFGAISVTADEVPGYLLVWIAFLGAYLAMRREGHISFEVLIDRLPDRAATVLRSIVDYTILAFLVLLLWQSVRMIWIDGATEIETADLAQGWFMAVLPAAALLLIVAVVTRAMARVRGAPSGN